MLKLSSLSSKISSLRIAGLKLIFLIFQTLKTWFENHTFFSTYCQVVKFIMQQQTETKSDVMFCFSVGYISDFFALT